MPRFRKALTILQPEMERYQPSRVTIALVSDGWTSVAKEKVVNYIVVSPVTRSLLWCAKTVGENEQTAEYVAASIGEAIDDINNTIGKPVVVSRRNTDEVLPASKTGLPNLHDPGFFRCR
ncbi:hypothetical protein JG688_00006385 [Phytophthora aleatoria]|uniref:DUF659 domain-containing protein n=1 Tax=Phytophthora aleatoria TaxID=2496075 RepID=A0A8J5ITR9_9STRA|nr:hypothetical protein JG688_00006385 [Phytophthora aleatoria]